MTTSDDNPFRAPQTSFEPVESKFDTSLRHLRICLGLQCTTIVLGVAAAFYDIYSILVTGAVLSLVGLLTAILSMRPRLISGLVFGLSGPAISAICFALINLLNWGPDDAQHPVSLIAAVYAMITVPLGLLVWTRTGSDSFLEELQNKNENALIADEVQHETKITG
jgi:nicotinamide riboside transporter PnuC